MSLTADPAFSAKYDEWVSELSGKDNNSISHQLADLHARFAVYYTVLMGREINRRTYGQLKINHAMHALLDQCFQESALMAVRRLTEKQSSNESRKIVSLRALIEDLKENHELLTRRNLRTAIGMRRSVELTDQFLEDWNTNFSRWAQTNPNSINDNDKVSQHLFDTLLRKLADFALPVEPIVNKHVAHASHPINRPANIPSVIVAGEAFQDRIAMLFSVSNCLRRILENAKTTTQIGGPFGNHKWLDVPLVSTQSMNEILRRQEEFWEYLDRQVKRHDSEMLV
jgi:hypothetical protein